MVFHSALQLLYITFFVFLSDVQSYIVEHGNHSNQPHPQCGDWFNLIQGMRFTNNGKYICGYVDSSPVLIQILESYRTVTGTSYSNQNLAQSIKCMDDNQLQTRFISPAARPRLFWQMNAGEPTIQYDGVPFMSVGHGTDLPCMQFGGRKKRINQISLPSGEVVPVDYRMKTGCEAKITIRQILRFPCAQYNETTVLGIAAIRRHRKQILDDLVQRVISGSSKAQERYYMLLPTPMAHNGHTLTEFDGPPPVSQPILDEIVDQLSSGVTAIVQLRERLKSFIYTTYGTEPSLHPNDPMYCLSEFEIFCQVYWLYKTGEVIDHDFKHSINRASGVEQSLNQATPNQKTGIGTGLRSIQATSSTAPTTSSSDAITSVYSIIMDDTSTQHHDSSAHHLNSPGPLGQMDDHSMATEQEVELNSGGSPASHNLGVVMDESSMVNQIQIRMGGGAGISGGLSHSQLQGSSHSPQQQQQRQLQQQGHMGKRSTPFGDPTPVSRSCHAHPKPNNSCYIISGNAEEVSFVIHYSY